MKIKTIKDFHELKEPCQEDKGAHKGKWFVFANSITAALIAKGDDYACLGDATTAFLVPPREFFFDSYDDAIDAAILYYIPFGKRYPYKHKTWNPTNSSNTIIESEVMVFE
jgi:hypothetical protein